MLIEKKAGCSSLFLEEDDSKMSISVSVEDLDWTLNCNSLGGIGTGISASCGTDIIAKKNWDS